MSPARHMEHWAWKRLRSATTAARTKRPAQSRLGEQPPGIKIALVGRQDTIASVACSVSNDPNLAIAGMADDPVELSNLVARSKPDVAIVDADLNGELSGVTAGRRLQRSLPSMGIALIAGDFSLASARPLALEFGTSWTYIHRRRLDDSEVFLQAVNSTARGIPWKDPELEDLLDAVWEIARRQREIEDGLRSADGQRLVPDAGVISVRGYEGDRPRSFDERRNERYDL